MLWTLTLQSNCSARYGFDLGVLIIEKGCCDRRKDYVWSVSTQNGYVLVFREGVSWVFEGKKAEDWGSICILCRMGLLEGTRCVHWRGFVACAAEVERSRCCRCTKHLAEVGSEH